MGNPLRSARSCRITGHGRPSARSIAVVKTTVTAAMFAVFIGSAGVVYAQDVVITTTGDRLVGEIKKIENEMKEAAATTVEA